MTKHKKILFINFGGLGDEILFLSTIQAVKEKMPKSNITLVLEKRAKSIIQITDCIDNLIFANIKNKNKYIKLLKLLIKIWFNSYDIVISSGANKFISIFLFLTFIPQKYGYNTSILSKLFLTKAIDLNKKQYAGQMYYDLAQHIVNKEFELPLLSIKKKPKFPNSILIHPGVSKLSIEKNMIKTIPPEQWAEVIEKLANTGKNVYLIGGPDDKNCIDIITKIVPKEKFNNLYGTTKNLSELAEIISSAEIFLCSDSAPLHIATSLKVKTFVIFGSTDDNKLVPKNSNTFVIKKQSNCPLQPCLWEKRKTTCDELLCLKLSTEEIINTIIQNMN